MIRRVVTVVALVVVVAGALWVGASRSGGDDTSPAARSRRLAAELRCPVCQGLSVADSPSDTARAMAADVRRRVDAGESDEEIRRAYVERYGEWILLEPPASGFGAVVWALPMAVLVLAAGVLALAFRRWRRQPALAASDADRELVERALASRRRPGEAG